MIITTEAGRIPIDQAFDYGDEQWWNMAQLALGTPYFLVTYSLDEMYATYILCRPTQLRAAVLDSSVKILDVQVIYRVPNTAGGSGWRVGQLQSVLIGVEGESPHSQRAFIFVLDDGTRILQAGLAEHERELADLEEWFSL